MSQILVQSPKHCAKQGFNQNKFYKRLFYTLSSFLVSLLLLVFIVWLILHPSKPEFYLKEANLYQLNLSAPHLLNSSLQVTLVSKNPNQKVGVYYDELQVYASYRGQRITSDTSLPTYYQGHQDNNILTAWLVGAGVPVVSSFGYEVVRDQTAGTLVLILKVNGRLRWKVGTWVSGHYPLNVNCVAFIAFPVPNSGPMNSRKGTQCSTSV